MRDWNKYIHQNKYSECQLISALNAYYYLTGKCIKQDSKKYENLVDLVKARNGSAIGIEKAWNKLGIKIVKESNSILDFVKNDTIQCPLEYNIWHKRYGFHSTLIVDHDSKIDVCRITNFKWIATLDGWMFREDMYQFEQAVTGRKTYRLFGLK